MDFFCVLSVGGSLASYRVSRESDAIYTAMLRAGSGPRDDIPAEVTLTKNADGWQAAPWHEEIARALIHAIDSNNGGINAG